MLRTKARRVFSSEAELADVVSLPMAVSNCSFDAAPKYVASK